MLLTRKHKIVNKYRIIAATPKELLEIALGSGSADQVRTFLHTIAQSHTIMWCDVKGIHAIQDVDMAQVVLPHILNESSTSRIPVCWLIRAAKHGNVTMLHYMLTVDQAFTRKEQHLALCQAAGYGQHTVVKILLDDGRFDPAWANNDALTCAAMNGHMACVQLLLDDPRSRPDDCDNRALAYAADAGHYDVVHALLQKENVDPFAMQGRAIRWAAAKGHLQVVRKLFHVAQSDIDGTRCL